MNHTEEDENIVMSLYESLMDALKSFENTYNFNPTQLYSCLLLTLVSYAKDHKMPKKDLAQSLQLMLNQYQSED